MADTVASPLLRMLSNRLRSLAGTNRILREMLLTLAGIQTLVTEAEGRSEDNEALRRWFTEIKDAAYDADDLLDDYEYERPPKFKVSNCFSLSKFKLDHKMKHIHDRLDQLLNRSVHFHTAAVKAFVAKEGLNTGYERRTSPFIDESDVFGRSFDKDRVVELLTDSEPQFSVISIVGMGGIGKTTVAQLVYNDNRVKHHFDQRCWVCVADNFDVLAIGSAIVSKCNLSMDELDSEVRYVLRLQRFLVVLDDVWNEDPQKWYEVEKWFNVGVWGSRVIITTRSERVAALMGTVMPYTLKLLSDDDCWSLFRSRAFHSTGDDENTKLVEIGKRIVTKCQGLPLAVKELGVFMRFKREERAWLSVEDNDKWNSPEFGSTFLSVLRLSYNRLPSHLKQCFAYFSIFPTDYKFDKEKLIQLWIAEGFVQSDHGSKRLEDIGNEYFMELLSLSFFMDIIRDDYGDIVKFQMHNLVHNLARSVAGIGCSTVGTGVLQNVSEEVRHLSLVFNSRLSTIPEALHEVKNVRTLILLSSKFEKIPSPFLRFRCLRVLDLSQSGIRELPGSVGNLRHLRYLDLSRTYIEILPQSISNLKSLLTLELHECYNLQELPRAICELANLRHLDIQSCCSLSHMPSGIGKLKLLQKLPVFVLGKSDSCGYLSELLGLDLRGKLEIKNLKYVKRWEDAQDAKLYEKVNLQSLGLSWGHDGDTRADMSAKVLESLEPPQNLRVLDIKEYRDAKFPSWIRNPALLNLKKVSLTNCNCQELPPLGQLPDLEDLYIKGMSAVEIIGYEFYGDGIGIAFPSLKQLEISDMPQLWEWRSFKMEKFSWTKNEESSGYQLKEAFPCLDTLTIKGCRMLTSLPFIPNLVNLALWNSNEMLLSSIAHLTSLSSLVIHEFRDPAFIFRDLGNLYFIKKLAIYDCDSVKSLLEEGMQGFTSLKHLSILYCDRLTSFSVGLRYLTSLQKLDIMECKELASIPDTIQYLSSLEELSIEGCPNLASVPDKLTSLQKLVIKRCPKLETRLDLEKGEDWSMKAHTPCIEGEIGELLL